MIQKKVPALLLAHLVVDIWRSKIGVLWKALLQCHALHGKLWLVLWLKNPGRNRNLVHIFISWCISVFFCILSNFYQCVSYFWSCMFVFYFYFVWINFGMAFHKVLQKLGSRKMWNSTPFYSFRSEVSRRLETSFIISDRINVWYNSIIFADL